MFVEDFIIDAYDIQLREEVGIVGGIFPVLYVISLNCFWQSSQEAGNGILLQ